MKLHYLDSGLSTNMGHHSNSCRKIVEEFNARNIGVDVYGYKDVEASLRDELKINPYFNWHTYYEKIDFAEWSEIKAFYKGWIQTLDDLNGLADRFNSTDIVYFNSVRPAQLMALANWVKNWDPKKMPTIVAEMGSASGLIRENPQSANWGIPDLRADPRPLFYRLAGEILQDTKKNKFHPIVFDEFVAQSYSALLGVNVKHTSPPRTAITSCRKRTTEKPIVISVLGEQRPGKGYELMPRVIELVLKKVRREVHFFVHNASVEGMPQIQETLRKMARLEARIEINEQLGTPDLWASFLEKSDLILCPYYPPVYMTSYSAIAVEALSNSIPLVVPQFTSLSMTLERLGGGVAFNNYSADSIADAVLTAIDNFETLACASHQASLRWRNELGPKQFVDSLIHWHQQAAAA